jgi:hypothetical protein
VALSMADDRRSSIIEITPEFIDFDEYQQNNQQLNPTAI